MKNINNLTKRLHDHEFSINNKNTKNNRLNKMYRSIENRTETILPNLSPKKLKFKTKLIKANDETIGDANLIKELKQKEFDKNEILVFDMNTKCESGFNLNQSLSPSIKNMIDKSFTPFISRISEDYTIKIL